MKLTIKTKIFLIFSITFIFLSLSLFPILIKVFSDDYYAFEKEKMTNNLNRLKNCLDFIVYNLDLKTSEWAAWDDIFNYAGNGDPAFIEDNIYPNQIKKLAINFILICSETGEVVFTSCFDPVSFENTEVPAGLLNYFTGSRRILNLSTSENAFSKGLMNFDDTVMLFSAKPILTSTEKGPPAGNLVFGTFLEKNLLKKLSELSSLNIEAINIKQIPGHPELPVLYPALERTGTSINTLNNLISGYRLINDPFGVPISVLKITQSMAIYERGMYTIRYFLYTSFVIIFVLMMANLFFIKKLILERLFNIFKNMKRISFAGGDACRIPVTGNDELAELSTEINEMLKKIETSFIDLKLSEEKLKEMVEIASSANRIKSRFLAVMSHEIRTPMNSIIGFSDFLDKTELNFDQKEMLHYIRTSSRALLDLINGILDFSKLEANKLIIENIEFNVIDVINEVCGILMINAMDKKIELACFIDPRLNYSLNGDPTRIRQIIINLTNNAIKFTEKGRVDIKVEVMSETRTDSTIKISIIDSGIGIAPDKQEKLFMPFVQADNTVTRKYGGTGLGLSISNELVKLMGGEKIFIESFEGKGSVFYFILNFKKGAMLSDRKNPEIVDLKLLAKRLPRRYKVLFAEDNEANIKFGLKLLTGAGFDVTLAENGQIAVEKARTDKYDIIVMDVQMPFLDGIEATRQIRKLKIKTPIIAASASVLREEQAECLKAGMNSFLTKPLNVNEFLNEIIKLLGLEKKMSGNDDSEPEISAPASGPFKSEVDGNRAVISSESADKVKAFDIEKIFRNMSGNKVLINSAISLFIEHYQTYMNEIRAAVDEGEPKKLEFSAHKLKGVALMAGASKMADTLLTLEKMGKNGVFEGAAELLNRISIEMDVYRECVKKIEV